MAQGNSANLVDFLDRLRVRRDRLDHRYKQVRKHGNMSVARTLQSEIKGIDKKIRDIVDRQH